LFKKTTTLNFHCVSYFIKETFPIYPAKKTISEFRKNKKWTDNSNRINDRVNGHVKHCPGIIDIIQSGYIVPAWKDFLVEVKDNKIIIEAMDNDSLAITVWSLPNHIINEDETWCDVVVKLSSPWFCKSEALILFKNIPYGKNHFFEAYEGVLDTNVHNEQNIFLKFKRKNAKYFIKAGTPLVQIIPLTTNNRFKINLKATKKAILNNNDKKYFKDKYNPRFLIYDYLRKMYIKYSKRIKYD